MVKSNSSAMKRSSWITGIIVLQLLYVLVLLALSVYFLLLARTSESRSGPDAEGAALGLKIAAGVLGGPALVAFVGWVGLWKEKLWGWWLTLITDLGLVGAFVYSAVDDGWKNIDWDLVILTGLSVLPVIFSLLPKVRRFYCGDGPESSTVRVETPQAN